MFVTRHAVHSAFLLIGGCALFGADRQVIAPPDVKPVGPYSSGIVAGEFLYVSGQGARRPDGSMPDTLSAQIHQCLDNVKAIVGAAGLTMEHIVFTQVYLTGEINEDELNRVWREVFPANPPARSIIGTAQLVKTPIEITAVAVKDLSRKRPIAPAGYPASSPVSPGVMVGDRLYLSGSLGLDTVTARVPNDPAEQVELAFDHMRQTLLAAGMDYRNLVFVNPYLTRKMPMEVMNRVYASHFEFGNTPARATISVASLPLDASIEFSGVAIGDLSQRQAVRPKNMQPSPTASPCVFAGDTFYCSAKSGFIPGPRSGIYAPTVETQVRQTMRNLLDGLEEAGLNFSNVVESHVYLDNMDDFARMNGVYGEYFSGAPPTRTTLQQILPILGSHADSSGRWPALEQISIIAVK